MNAEIASDALFFQSPEMRIKNRPHTATRHIYGCHQACENSGNMVEESAVSRVCDATCINDGTWVGFRFNGRNCGAGNSLKYGESCRLCFTDQQAALDADKTLADSDGHSSTFHEHVIMCDTRRPPESIDCSTECKESIHTVRRLENEPVRRIGR